MAFYLMGFLTVFIHSNSRVKIKNSTKSSWREFRITRSFNLERRAFEQVCVGKVVRKSVITELGKMRVEKTNFPSD